MKKLFAIILVVLLLLTGCNNTSTIIDEPDNYGENNNSKYPESISLMYSETATLNPYDVSTSKLNTQLMYLLYDPLVKLNNSFEVEYLIADSCVLTDKRCVVTLKNLTFSDGSTITADDIIFSYNKAIKTSKKYEEQFKNVKSASAIDSKTVSFILNKHDIYFENLLDFPIIKQGTDNWYDENNFKMLPTGCGKYIFDSKTSSLLKNPYYTLSEIKVNTINLLNAPDSEVINHYISTNSVSAFTSDQLNLERTTTNGNVFKANSNNLIYIGVNMNRKILSDVKMRYVISYAIDRTKLCTESFYGYASPATGIYNSNFSDAKGLQNLELSQNTQLVLANLEELGYNNKNADGYYINDAQSEISLRILVCSDNKTKVTAAKQIASQLVSCGIKATIVESNWDTYKSALEAGLFDLYIGEVAIPKNLDITQIVTENGSAAYGIVDTDYGETDSATSEVTSNNIQNNKQHSLRDALTSFYNDKASLHDILNAFNSELPIIPICHKYESLVCDNSLTYSQATPSFVDLYDGIATIAYK